MTVESRQHYIDSMVQEDEQNNWTTQPTYDALLIRYLPKLLSALDRHLHPQKAEPLPLLTTDVSRFCTKLEKQLKQSMKTVEFFDVRHRTKGNDLSKFIERYTTRLKADLEWVTTWVDIWCKYVYEKNGFNKIVRECNKINKARATTEEKRVKEQAKAEAKQARVMAPKAKAKPKAKPVVPTVSRKVDFEFFEHHLLVTKNRRELREIEAQMQTETWTVITKLDTAILKHWVDEASKYQAELMTNPRAIAPEPIKLTTDACFSTPMLSKGRRRVTGVKWLREVARGAPTVNKARINYIIELYEKGEIGNLKTAETS